MTSSDGNLRKRLAAGHTVHGVWSLLPGAVTADRLARTGADFVVTDLQHGATTESELPGIAAAVTAAGAVPLVRTRSPGFADIGRPLDLGACGVIVPNVRDAAHAREVVAATRYAPVGGRSIGRLTGGSDQPLVIVMIEAASALADLEAVLGVDGLDGVYVGPGDLGLSLGLAAGSDQLRDRLLDIVARAAARGVPVGVHAYSGEEAAGYAAAGATIVTVAVDAVLLRVAATHHLDVARSAPRTDD